jgi:hypothetical protein
MKNEKDDGMRTKRKCSQDNVGNAQYGKLVKFFSQKINKNPKLCINQIHLILISGKYQIQLIFSENIIMFYARRLLQIIT